MPPLPRSATVIRKRKVSQSIRPLPRSETCNYKMEVPDAWKLVTYISFPHLQKQQRFCGCRIDCCGERTKASARGTLWREWLTYCGWRCISTVTANNIGGKFFFLLGSCIDVASSAPSHYLNQCRFIVNIPWKQTSKMFESKHIFV